MRELTIYMSQITKTTRFDLLYTCLRLPKEVGLVYYIPKRNHQKMSSERIYFKGWDWSVQTGDLYNGELDTCYVWGCGEIIGIGDNLRLAYESAVITRLNKRLLENAVMRLGIKYPEGLDTFEELYRHITASDPPEWANLALWVEDWLGENADWPETTQDFRIPDWDEDRHRKSVEAAGTP